MFHLELTLDSQALRHQLCLWINRDDFDSTGRKNSSFCVGKVTEEHFLIGAYLNTSCIHFQSWSLVQNVARDFCFGISSCFA